jgi:hypothetical protein
LALVWWWRGEVEVVRASISLNSLKEEWGAKISDRASLFKPTVAT